MENRVEINNWGKFQKKIGWQFVPSIQMLLTASFYLILKDSDKSFPLDENCNKKESNKSLRIQFHSTQCNITFLDVVREEIFSPDW